MLEERMQQLFNTSLRNVEEAIEGDEPDLRMSAWFMETYLKNRGTRLQATIKKNVKTLEDVETVSTEAVEAALKGEITLEEAKHIQEMIGRHMALSGAVELTRLREELEAFKETHNVGNTHSNAHMPAWGRLQEITSKPEGELVPVAPEAKPKAKSKTRAKTNGKGNGHD